MDTVTRDNDNGTASPLPPPDITPYFRALPGPDVTPLFTEVLEAAAARRGLPPEPRAA